MNEQKESYKITKAGDGTTRIVTRRSDGKRVADFNLIDKTWFIGPTSSGGLTYAQAGEIFDAWKAGGFRDD